MLTQDCVLGYCPAVPPGRWGIAGQFSRPWLANFLGKDSIAARNDAAG